MLTVRYVRCELPLARWSHLSTYPHALLMQVIRLPEAHRGLRCSLLLALSILTSFADNWSPQMGVSLVGCCSPT